MDLEAFAEALESIRTDQWGPYRTEILAALRRSARPEVEATAMAQRLSDLEAFVKYAHDAITYSPRERKVLTATARQIQRRAARLLGLFEPQGDV